MLKTKFTLAISFVFAVALYLPLSVQAGAPAPSGWDRSSTVDSQVTNNNNGTWTYRYTVNNTSRFTETGPDSTPFLVDWELPWFGDAGIDLMSIVSPTRWNFAIETIGVSNSDTGWDGIAAWQDPADPFYAGPNSPFTSVTQVLHWYSECWVAGLNDSGDFNCEGSLQDAISPGGSLFGFGFDAAFDETNAPYQASWAFLPIRSGDPAFPLGGFPNSPAVSGVQNVPEPGLLGLLGIGLAAGLLARRSRV